MYLFVHHCDLRIVDNKTINYLIENKIDFVPIFIGTPEQLDKNDYKSENSIRFMFESLRDLEDEYKKYNKRLYYFYGDTIDVLEDLIKSLSNKIKGIANNVDYSPYAIDRDTKVSDLCNRLNITYLSKEDKLLNPVDSILTKKGTEYTKFTPYYKTAINIIIDKPSDLTKNINLDKSKNNNFELKSENYSITLDKLEEKVKNLSKKNNISILGGRKQALKILENLEKFSEYNEERNFPFINTTHLSSYLKFGCVSIREVYYTILNNLGEDNELIKQLYWRDFYSMLLYNYGSFDVPVSITKENLNEIKWETKNKLEYLDKWKLGMTGCPIVDAGMREMNATGFMHNRLRMIVAMFLTFYLKIDWREGMKYFSQKLIDADWANNLGNWQWVAGVEKWSNDYFRVFSMESQVKRFDPDCIYIKKWVPELKDVELKDIMEWDTNYINYTLDYPEPIIKNNKESRKEGVEMYKKAILI